jgi:hypothetical protein
MRTLERKKEVKEEVKIKDSEVKGRIKKEVKDVVEKEFGELNTDKVILRDERIEHIKERHPEIVEIIKKYSKDIIENPDYILKDNKNIDTIWHIKEIDKNKINAVIKLSIKEKQEHKGYLNSIITGYPITEKRLEKHLSKLKILYKIEGK